jgi:hypothetical protein
MGTAWYSLPKSNLMSASRELQYKPRPKALRRCAEGLFGVAGVVVGVPGCYWLRSLEEF